MCVFVNAPTFCAAPWLLSNEAKCNQMRPLSGAASIARLKSRRVSSAEAALAPQDRRVAKARLWKPHARAEGPHVSYAEAHRPAAAINTRIGSVAEACASIIASWDVIPKHCPTRSASCASSSRFDAGSADNMGGATADCGLVRTQEI